jgi:hypothetical protein
VRAPDGRECELYYEDFHRGRDVQECRAKKSEKSAHWQPKDCAKCPVPDILRANSSPNMEIEITIQRPLLGLVHRVKAHAYCVKHKHPIENPYTGCPECNSERPGLSLFAEALENLDD